MGRLDGKTAAVTRGANGIGRATARSFARDHVNALVGSKQEMLVACIAERARCLQIPAEVPERRDRDTLSCALIMFGTQLLREVSDPTVIAVFQLAIAEAVRAPQVARALDDNSVETSRAAVHAIVTRARSAGLLDGEVADMTEQFFGLLWGNLMTRLLLGVVERPGPREIARRAEAATAALLQLHGRHASWRQ